MPEKKRLNNIIQMTFKMQDIEAVRYLAKRLHLSSSILCKNIVLEFLKHPAFEVMLDRYHKPQLK